MNRQTLERADHLLELIRTQKAGPDDYEELLQLMDANPEPWFVAHLQHYFSANPMHVPEYSPSSYSAEWRMILQSVLEADKPVVEEPEAPVRSMRTWLRVAAAALVLLSAGTYIWYNNKQQAADKPQPLAALRVVPGSNGAVLTLGDGSTVVLDSLGNGLVTAQAGTRVMLQNGQLAYESGDAASGPAAWNIMSTPKGRQFRLTLPDGTHVWLNAASAIRYPTAFKGADRKVELTGEAYFEVVKNTEKPFRVVIGDTTEIEVLGTNFNINSYTDEPVVRTTLLEGSIRVKKSNAAVLLQPGQQAVIRESISIDRNANISGAIAWKNGQFNFEGATLEEFMRQLSRWYDIEVVYKGQTPKMRIRGKLGRDLVLPELLEALADFGIHCKLENRKLIIQ